MTISGIEASSIAGRERMPEFRARGGSGHGGRLVERYLAKFGLQSIFIAANYRREPVKFGHNTQMFDREPADRLMVWERKWCSNKEFAKMILRDVMRRGDRLRIGNPDDLWLRINVDEARSMLFDSSRNVGVPLVPNAVVTAARDEMLSAIAVVHTRMQQGGELKEFNRKFKAMRDAKIAAGESRPDFQACLYEYLSPWIDEIAKQTVGKISISG